jgi:hypothetical protein
MQSRFRQTEILSTRKIQTYRSMIFVKLSSFLDGGTPATHTFTFPQTYHRTIYLLWRFVKCSRPKGATRAVCRFLGGQTKVIFVRHRIQKLVTSNLSNAAFLESGKGSINREDSDLSIHDIYPISSFLDGHSSSDTHFLSNLPSSH